jgi:hypothetical protein
MIEQEGGDPETDFDPFLDCGHRSPADMIPDYELSRYIAFQIANKNPMHFRRICETWTDLELWEVYGFRRNSLYQELEDLEEEE